MLTVVILTNCILILIVFGVYKHDEADGIQHGKTNLFNLVSERRKIQSHITMATTTADANSGAIVAGASSAAPVSISAISNPITICLTRDNFLLWKTQAVPALYSQGLFGYVDGTFKAPPHTIKEGTGDAAREIANPAFLRWYQQDQTVMIALLGSMSEDILGQMTQLTTSAAVWATLQDMFATQNRARLMQIRYQLSNLKKKDLSASEYYYKMKGFADAMASAGKPLSDDEILGYMLAGLGPEFEPLVASVTTRDEPLRLSSFYAFFLSAELRLEQQTSAGEIHSSANAAARHSEGNRGGRGGQGGGGQGGQNRGGRGGQGQGRGRGNNRSNVKCQVCGKYGHEALRCRQRFNYSYQPEDNRDRSGNYSANSGSYSVDPHWYMDSGATDHLTSDLDRLSVHERYGGKDKVQVANGAGLNISHVGHSTISGSSSKPLYLRNILHVPHISRNLLSTHRLVSDNNAFAEFHPHVFYLKDQTTKKILLQGRSRGGLYPVPGSTPPCPSHSALSGVKLSSDLWHRRLGHPSRAIVESVLRTNKIACVPSNNLSSVCDACQRAKVHQLPFRDSSHLTHAPLELIHSDVWGPTVTSIGGFKYYVSFLDDFSRFTWIYLLKRKSDVEEAFYTFQKHVERMLNTKIRAVQSDWGGEYHRLSRYFQREGILHRVSCPHTSQQNGIAERKHRHLVETDIALLAHSSLPVRFWDEAFITACYLINRMPTRVLGNSSPISRLFHEEPDYSFLKAFGCACWPNLRPYNNRKLEFRSRQCVFLGYSSMHKGYKCLDRSSGRIYISDVVFDEHVFPFESTTSRMPTTSNPPQPSLFPITEPTIVDDRMRRYDTSLLTNPASSNSIPSTGTSDSASPSDSSDSDSPNTPLRTGGHHPDGSPSPSMSRSGFVPDDASPVMGSTSPPARTTSVSTPSSGPTTGPVSAPPSAPVAHPMATRLRHNIIKKLEPTDGTVRYDPRRRAFHAAPRTYREALSDASWRPAMESEFVALQENKTWSLVPRPPGCNIIGCKWVFKVKHKADGSLDKFKARLVAKGFTQKQGIDYSETFSPVVKPATVRLVLSLAVSRGWHLRQVDISNAFLHGFLTESAYMQQPPGFQDLQHPDYVCKLNKAIYGLKQSPRAWYSRLSDRLQQLGFTPSAADTSLFIFAQNGVTMYMLVYVDDIVIVSSSSSALDSLLHQLSSTFPVKDLGSLSYFLGIEVIRNPGGISLTQKKYAVDLLERTNMANCKSVSTPMCTHDKLSCESGHKLNEDEAFTYRSTVGALQYLTLTRPDLSFAVNKVCQFLAHPTDVHWEAVKRILRYVKGTVSTGLNIRRCTSTLLSVFTDAD
uniref:Uncharacterized protein n=1 Tax=Avena sativa TaxID=4498 RepID=A0ACD5TNX4_AVESA